MVFKRDRAAGGYILVEVIVSLVVFSIGALSVMRTLSAATQARGLTQDFTIAGFLCQQAMTESRAEGASEEGQEHGDFGDEYAKFGWSRTVEIVMVEPAGPPEEKRQPEPSGLPWKRSPLSERLQGKASPLSERLRGKPKQAKEREPIPFVKTSVVVSWKRRGAGYSVSAETMVPVDAETIKTGGREADVGA